MVELSLALLGPFSVVYQQRPLTQFRTKSVQGLLAYLVCHPHQVHRRERLMTLIWPDVLPKSAQANLRHTLYHLRQAIPVVTNVAGETVPFVVADRHTIQLNPDGRFQVDLHQFEALTEPAASAGDLETAISLYRDDFLGGFYLPDSSEFESWLEERRTECQRRYLDALDRLTLIHLENGNLHEAEALARRQLELDNLREVAHGQLMKVMALSGRRTDAVSHYHRLCQLLEDELGIAPSAATEKLVDAIRTNNFDDTMHGGTLAAEKASVLEQPPRNLPVPLTPFIGRETELLKLSDLLLNSQARLVTIFGPGGIGKTRLAIATAEKLSAGPEFPDGVFFVPLAGIPESDRISSAIAKSLHLRLEQGESQLVRYLQSRQLLLVLDNFEHLLSGVDLVGRLLAAAPNLRILTTSRERLRLHGEQLFPIEGLKVDSQATIDDARKLFLQGARRIRPDFQPTAENSPALNMICSLVEGMPLALELAAACLDVLTVSDIVVDIQQSIGFLETDLRDMPLRHRSMRAVFDTSWKQLSESEQQLLAQASIFRGGFTREAVTAVTQATVQELVRLVNKSLLSFVGEDGRYHIHELLRQYCATHLREDRQLLERYRTHYCQWLISQKDALHSPRQPESVRQIQADMDNIRKAITGCIVQEQFSELQPALAVLNDFYVMRGHQHEAITLFEELVHQLDEYGDQVNHIKVWLFIWLSGQNGMIFREPESKKRWKEAKAILQNPLFRDRDTRAERAAVNVQEAYSNFRWGHKKRAAQLFRESLALFGELNDPVWQAHCLLGLGRTLRNLDDYEGARNAFARSLTIAQQLGDPVLQLEPRLALGFQETNAGHLEKAEETLENTLSDIRVVDHPELLRMGLRYLSVAQMMNGRFATALRTTQERREVEKESGSYESELLQESLARALINLHRGQYEEASKIEQVVAQGAPSQYQSGYFISDAFVVSGLAAIAKGEPARAKEKFQDSKTYYRGPWVCSWIHRYQIGQALAAAMTGEMTSAHRLIQAELRMYVGAYREERPNAISFILAVLSYVVATQGQSRRAVELYALARKNAFVTNSRWVVDVIGNKITAVSSTIAPATVAAAQSHGRELDLIETAESIAAESTESGVRA